MITSSICSLIVGFGIGYLIADMIAAAKSKTHVSRIRQLEVKFSRLKRLIKLRRETASLKKDINHATAPTKF